MWNYNKYAENIALYSEDNISVTYSQLQQEENKITNVISRRCLIFILCQNKIGSIIGYSALINKKIVPVLLSANQDKTHLNNLISLYKPSYLWLPQEQTGIFPELEIVYSAWDYSLLQTNFDMEYELNTELCLLLTTSGSTGSPKFVRQSYKNVKENAKAIVNYLELDESDRPITTLPMNYTYGLSIINSHFMAGATILVTDKGLMQKEFWNFFKEQKATSFGGVPYTYEMLSRLRFFKMNLPYLQYMTQAGGKLSLQLHQSFAKYAIENGKKFIIMYGQCEATARMAYLPADKAIEKCGSIGITIPGGKLRLIDENKSTITEPYNTGELIYEGPNVTLGYAESGNDLSKGDERNGILQTGDMAQFDEEGYYYIVGRKKRFLKIYGNRVNLDEIDNMIKEKYRNLNAASTGIDDHMHIFITKPNLTEEIRSFVAAKTKINPAAFHVSFIENIPINDSGKVLYSELMNRRKKDEE